ncbi:MAG: hypothetical protein RMM08_12790 [Armatimonadota bacterium]|nr:hypothetical protein [bacterium]MDW8322228.1 hypothetical protein [Armatimonadota bacterium]
MLRKWLWLGVLAIATVTLAQTYTVQGSAGLGTAVNEDGKPGMFRYEVKKIIHNDAQRTVLQGHFHFVLVNREERTELTVSLVKLTAYRQRITDAEKVAEFKGLAVLSVMSPRGGKRVRGEVIVLVKDNRAANVQEGSPDEILVRFVASDPAKPFVFRGTVARGDIVIFEHHLPR